MTIKELKLDEKSSIPSSQFCVVFFLRLPFSVWLQTVTTSSRFWSYHLQVQQKEEFFCLQVLKKYVLELSFNPRWPNLGYVPITWQWEWEALIVQA